MRAHCVCSIAQIRRIAMSKLSINVDSNFRPSSQPASGVRSTIRRVIHPPERRAMTPTLLLIAALTFVLMGGIATGLLQ